MKLDDIEKAVYILIMDITHDIAIGQYPPEVLTPKELRMEKAGATREAAYKVLVEGLSAETMTLDKFGGEHVAPDNPSRLRASEMILKMRGDIRPETVVDNRTVNISGVSGEVTSQLLHMVKDVAMQLAALRTSGQQTGEIIDVEKV
jgi:hypothetical protein